MRSMKTLDWCNSFFWRYLSLISVIAFQICTKKNSSGLWYWYFAPSPVISCVWRGDAGENTTCDIRAEITRQSEIPRTLNAAICLLIILLHCSGSNIKCPLKSCYPEGFLVPDENKDGHWLIFDMSIRTLWRGTETRYVSSGWLIFSSKRCSSLQNRLGSQKKAKMFWPLTYIWHKLWNIMERNWDRVMLHLED